MKNVAVAFSLILLVACSSSQRNYGGPAPDAGAPAIERPNQEEESYEADDFWENDPPPQWCGPGKAPANAIPGGTPECPDDKNKEGCPCDKVGEEAPCWPGLRKNRNLGICKDGVAHCEADGEFGKKWSACKGAVKPRSGATKGADACTCFSKGKWDIENVVPCFVEISTGEYAAVSTVDGKCPTNLIPGEMPTKPSGKWSANTLTADCAGEFELCYTIKAGDVKAPDGGDCVLAKTCTQGEYTTANKAQTFPDLPHWVSQDTSCATQFVNGGGYAEMTVTGKSVRCDEVSDNGKPLVFLRSGFCPLTCNQNPTAPECKNCSNNASGEF